MLEQWVDDVLACPDCGRDLGGGRCACGFAIPDEARRDLRPQRPQPRTMTFALGAEHLRDLERVDVTRPQVTYGGPRAARDSSELFSAAAHHLERGASLLDLGCGPRDQAAPAEHLGLRYVGVDYDSGAADLLADAHALPFRTSSFDAVLSYAVLEHLYNPFVAAREVARVLAPGGVFFGTVSQGEPFHDSWFHHTTFGVLSVLRSAGFEVLRMWPAYDTLHALATMGRYSRPQRMLIEAVHRFGLWTPFLTPRKTFRWSQRERDIDALHRTAAICFVARKPANAGGTLP